MTVTRDELLEELAEVEHRQWMTWACAVMPEVSTERRMRWRRFIVPYAELPEEVKELDREQAREILCLLERCGLLYNVP